MKRVILSLALSVAPLLAGQLSQEDREFAMSNLHASRKMFLDAIAGLSEAQWKFKPAPDRWSIAECAEHIARSEDFLFQLATDKVMNTTASPPQTPPARERDEAVLKMVTDRSQKFNAPEPLRPTGEWPAEEALVQHFKQSRDRTIRYAETTQDDLRSHSMKDRDAYQWLLFLSGHCERHTAQINEVKADPNFPRN